MWLVMPLYNLFCVLFCIFGGPYIWFLTVLYLFFGLPGWAFWVLAFSAPVLLNVL